MSGVLRRRAGLLASLGSRLLRPRAQHGTARHITSCLMWTVDLTVCRSEAEAVMERHVPGATLVSVEVLLR